VNTNHRNPNSDFQRVRKFVLSQVKSSLDAGFEMAPGDWRLNKDEGASCCAVGALAFNGDPNVNCDNVYTVAPDKLRMLGIKDDDIGCILDAMSAGFELQGIVQPYHIPQHFRNYFEFRANKLGKYKPYYNLGRNIRRRYYTGETGVRI
jgi:hypothetical protein